MNFRVIILELMVSIWCNNCACSVQIGSPIEQVVLDDLTFLHAALSTGDWASAQVLLDYGVDPYQMINGHNAFDYARHNKILLGRLRDYVWKQHGQLDDLSQQLQN